MLAWEELVTSALLGTERRGKLAVSESAGQRDDALGRMSDRLTAAGAEEALLSRAAALALYRRAGRRPTLDSTPLPAACPPDDRPAIGAAATRRLERLLTAKYSDLLPEWLMALAAAGKRISEVELPALLDYGARHRGQSSPPTSRALTDLIVAVLGQRGHWLAAQNPDWSYAIEPVIDEGLWETGNRSTRQHLLTELRRRDPNRARALLESTWSSENGDDQSAFLAILAIGLGPADEPFLEAALDNRRQAVRHQAAELLARLPESQLVARMIARVEPLLTFVAGRPGNLLVLRTAVKPRLSVLLPDECDPAMSRDGIRAKRPANEQIGEKAYWLRQMLAVIPPSYWSRRWSTTAIHIVNLAGTTDWKAALWDGWVAAALTHADAEWALALLTIQPDQTALLSVLSAEQVEPMLIRALATHQGSVKTESPVIRLLQGWAEQTIFSPALTETVVTYLKTWAASGAVNKPTYYALRWLLPELASRMAPTAVDSISQGWPTEAKNGTDWSDSISEAVAILQFRHDMLKEIAE